MQTEVNTDAQVNQLMVAPRLYWNRIFHPTDFSDTSTVAFAHALKLAAREHGRLTMMHTDADTNSRHWQEFPRVRHTLERWGVLPPNSPKEAVAELGLDIVKISAPQDDVVEAITHYLKKHPQDLIVLATHQYDGIERWTHKPIAETVARRSGEMTLFMPEGLDGFIDANNGLVSLRTILIPVDKHPHPQVAIEAAASIAGMLECRNVNFVVLHVGAEKDFPAFDSYPRENWHWQTLNAQGHVEEEILAAADRLEADLIVMATEGRHGFLDALRGSTTDHIVRQADCPVLAVPRAEKTPESWQESPVWSPVN